MTTRDSSLTWAAWTLALVAILFLLRATGQLLIPIVVAVLISYAFEPVVAWAASKGVPRIAGAGLLIGVVVGGAGWSAYALRDDALVAIEALPSVAQKARALVWSDRPDSPVQQVQRAAEALNGTASEKGGEQPAAEPASFRRERRGVGAGGPSVPCWRSLDTSPSWSFSSFSCSSRAGTFASGSSRSRVRISSGAGSRPQIIDEINSQIQRFLLVQLVTAVVVAMATTAGLAWMGVSQAAVWGILAGLFNSIPYFGPVVVSGGLVLVGLVQSGDPMLALKISAMALVITSLEGWVLNPLLMGRAERMHVVVVFLGVLLWTWIWGPWGTLLAVPMLVVLKAVADHVDSLKPVGRLDGALTRLTGSSCVRRRRPATQRCPHRLPPAERRACRSRRQRAVPWHRRRR